MSSRVRFAVVLLLIVAAIPLAWWLFLAEPPVTPPVVLLTPDASVVSSVDAGPRVVEISLGEITGTVQIRSGASGQWREAKLGDVLHPSDGVRTSDGSYAVLVGEETWQVKMEPGTEVGIGELKESITKLLLESGMARATVKGGGRHVFEVRAANSDAVARTDGGVFTIASNGQGTVAVGSESGEVAFAGGGRVVIVRAGQQSIVKPGQAPTEPVTVPKSLLLKVALPARQTVNTPKLTLKGTVDPGALVEVQGRIVRVDAQGRFEVPVQLKEGKNPLQIRARGVGGGEAKQDGQVELDTTVRPTTIDKNLWK
ncbi:MAG: hypothetical protein DI536_04550 [Archangium gephyra]|uniref:Uncharacterized protein n=1 Tax=Archangium gephyra TaxID=48 RepID=A0A2W5TPJ3_9BACT|nr:MAG: hypothetical protein DI536_04550 [Archangium gephyra]